MHFFRFIEFTPTNIKKREVKWAESENEICNVWGVKRREERREREWGGTERRWVCDDETQIHSQIDKKVAIFNFGGGCDEERKKISFKNFEHVEQNFFPSSKNYFLLLVCSSFASRSNWWGGVVVEAIIFTAWKINSSCCCWAAAAEHKKKSAEMRKIAFADGDDLQ